MKKLFSLALIAVCTVSLMGSCKKKGGNEPTPSVPIDKTKGIKLQLASGQTDVTISSLSGEGITIEGVTAQWSTTSKTLKASAAGSVITIKGNVTALNITGGQLEKLDLSMAPVTLKTLRATSSTASPTTIKILDFSGATALDTLKLSGIGSSGNHNLSNSKLRYAELHKTGSNFTLPNTITLLYLSENGIANELTLTAFPEMKRLYLIGAALNKNVNFSGSSQLTTFSNSRSMTPKIDLSNCSQLANVLLRDMNGTTEVNLSNSPKLKEGEVKSLTNITGFCTDTPNDKLKVLNLAGASLTKFDADVCKFVSLTDLDLSNNKLASADFSEFTTLKKLSLVGNSTLTGENLTKALTSLPATSGTLKITNLSDSDKKIVTDKGWTISQ